MRRHADQTDGWAAGTCIAPVRMRWRRSVALLFLLLLEHALASSKAEKEGDREHEAQEASEQANFVMGLTMIGGLVLIMGLFYLVHFQDVDVRMTTWSIISNTTSIFCAVLLFSFSEWLFEVFLFGGVENFEFNRYVNQAFVVVWYGILFLASAWTAGVGRGLHYRQSVIRDTNEMASARNLVQACLLCAHATAFAGISGWGRVQNYRTIYSSTAGGSFLIIPVAFFKWWFILRCLSIVRYFWLRRFVEGEIVTLQDQTSKKFIIAGMGNTLRTSEDSSCANATFDVICDGDALFLEDTRTKQRVHSRGNSLCLGPGDSDTVEAARLQRKKYGLGLFVGSYDVVTEKHDELIDIFNEKLDDGENDMYSLMVSFLFVQSLRYLIGGTLPNHKGEEEGRSFFEHDARQVTLLYLCTLLLVLGCYFTSPNECTGSCKIVTQRFWGHFESHRLGRMFAIGAKALIDRLGVILFSIQAMSFSWCFMYATQWWIAGIFRKSEDRAAVQVVLAIVVTILCFIAIPILDKFADDGNASIRKIIPSLGFLIGFTWESCFDTAIEGAIEGLPEGFWRIACKSFLGLGTTAIILPAWILYIVPMNEESGFRMGFHTRRVVDRINAMKDGKHERVYAHAIKSFILALRGREEGTLGVEDYSFIEELCAPMEGDDDLGAE
eukprot:TRINITY_DN14392_c0_g1_i1.p1 TRINITY_DN14392_c0_g1~~TRINITY_DN14392_c0_g1_i1.p1  ORF type:complete len:667 (+),score=84.34 TRINITY_DN14392_c0_g1_i1:145-2145(+)